MMLQWRSREREREGGGSVRGKTFNSEPLARVPRDFYRRIFEED